MNKTTTTAFQGFTLQAIPAATGVAYKIVLMRDNDDDTTSVRYLPSNGIALVTKINEPNYDVQINDDLSSTTCDGVRYF